AFELVIERARAVEAHHGGVDGLARVRVAEPGVDGATVTAEGEPEQRGLPGQDLLEGGASVGRDQRPVVEVAGGVAAGDADVDDILVARVHGGDEGWAAAAGAWHLEALPGLSRVVAAQELAGRRRAGNEAAH